MHQPVSLLKPATRWQTSHPANGWTWLQRVRSDSDQPQGPLVDTARSPKMARLEAALFVADGALSMGKLAKTATLQNAKEAAELIEQLNELYDADGSAFRIEQVATGVQMLTRPEFAVWLDRIHNRQAALKLSSPAMETLAIIAYRQPCTRADVEAIRGVQCSEMIKQLMERNLVRITGEDDSLGRPYLYGTTKLFLESFGVQHLNKLPMAEMLAPKTHEPEPDAATETLDVDEVSPDEIDGELSEVDLVSDDELAGEEDIVDDVDADDLDEEQAA